MNEFEQDEIEREERLEREHEEFNIEHGSVNAEKIQHKEEPFIPSRSFGGFALKGAPPIKIAMDQKAPDLGKICELTGAPPMVVNQQMLPTIQQTLETLETLKSSCIRPLGKMPVQDGTRHKLKAIQEKIIGSPAQASEHPEIHPEPKPAISIERLVFLERVERIMASEARIKEIEAENKTLVGMVTRLQKEIDDLKAKGSQKL